MLRYYDPYTKEFVLEAAPALKTFGYVTFFTLLLLATASFFFIRLKMIGWAYEFSEFSAAEHQSTTFTSALLGFVCLAVCIFVSFSLPSMLAPTKYIIYKYTQLAAYILLFFVAAYFIINAMGSPRLEKIKKVIAFLIPLWGVAFALASYTNPLYLYNDFNRMTCNASVCALTFFFLYEAKGTALKKTKPVYFIFSLLATVMCMVYVLPNYILFAYWELTSELHFLFEAVELGALCYMISVSFVLVSSLQKCELPKAPESGRMPTANNTGKKPIPVCLTLSAIKG